MIYCDIHTHRPPTHQEDIAVVALDVRQPYMSEGGYYAAGIHPWFADREALALLRAYAAHPQVIAIGETGLDKLSSTSWTLQEELFTTQIQLAGEVRKPLIIHCVKAWQELMAIRKIAAPDIPWIIHGFRGNAFLATQLLHAGFYLSFGFRFQSEALRQAWKARRLLVETDNISMDIREIYASLSSQLSIPEETFAQEILESVGEIFNI